MRLLIILGTFMLLLTSSLFAESTVVFTTRPLADTDPVTGFNRASMKDVGTIAIQYHIDNLQSGDTVFFEPLYTVEGGNFLDFPIRVFPSDYIFIDPDVDNLYGFRRLDSSKIPFGVADVTLMITTTSTVTPTNTVNVTASIVTGP